MALHNHDSHRDTDTFSFKMKIFFMNRHLSVTCTKAVLPSFLISFKAIVLRLLWVGFFICNLHLECISLLTDQFCVSWTFHGGLQCIISFRWVMLGQTKVFCHCCFCIVTPCPDTQLFEFT